MNVQLFTSLSRTLVTVRRLKPHDIALIEEMHRRLSPRSMYARYLSNRMPSTDQFEDLLRLDRDGNKVFVVVTQQRPEAIIGLAYYVVQSESQPATAEPALLIEDEYQGQGLGTFLFDTLSSAAYQSRICRFTVFIERGNRAMFSILRKSGLRVEEHDLGDVSEIHMQLDHHDSLCR